jgi:hypothetical protein
LEAEYKAKADEALTTADIAESLGAKRLSEIQLLQERVEVCTQLTASDVMYSIRRHAYDANHVIHVFVDA